MLGNLLCRAAPGNMFFNTKEAVFPTFAYLNILPIMLALEAFGEGVDHTKELTVLIHPIRWEAILP